MIEVLFAKAWNRLASPRRKLAAESVVFFKSLRYKRTGITLAIATPLLVIIWHTAVLANRPAHLDEIVKELGSSTTGRFFRDPMPDNSGTRLLFLESTENGVGLFYSKIAEGHRKLLYEEPYRQPNTPSERFLGWSPDDKFFAFSRCFEQWEIVICDGDTGSILATFPTATRAISGAWLSPHNLAFMSEDGVLFMVENLQEKWLVPKRFAYFGNTSHRIAIDPITTLTALDGDSVVWQQGNTIWCCSENAHAPTKIWESATNTLLEFSYSQSARRFLFHCKDTTSQFLMYFYPYQPEQPENITKIDSKEYHPRNLTFINGGKGFAFISHDAPASNTLVIKLDDSHNSVRVQWPYQITGYSAGQQEIFITSSIGNDPIEINQYNINSGSTECVAPVTEEHFDYLTNCAAERCQITNASGDLLTYYLFASPNLKVKKHPLMIGVPGAGQIGYAWSKQTVAFANCGFYYVYVDREHRSSSEWVQDMLTVYEDLMNRSDVDAKNVYLYGVSVGAFPVYELLKEKPGLWKGAIFFSPIFPSDSRQLSGKKLFIDCGGSDPQFGKNGSDVPQRFQDELAKAGTPMTLLIHTGSEHSLWSPTEERERMRAALIFLSEP